MGGPLGPSRCCCLGAEGKGDEGQATSRRAPRGGRLLGSGDEQAKGPSGRALGHGPVSTGRVGTGRVV